MSHSEEAPYSQPHEKEATSRFTTLGEYRTTGIQARVDIGEFAGRRAIRKIVGEGLSGEAQYQVYEAVPEYRRQLNGAGLRPPGNLSHRLLNDGIESVDEFLEGNDIDVLVRSGEGVEAWRHMVDTLVDLNGGDHQSVLMLDAKPANWVSDENGSLHFVDLFPPALRDSEGMLTPWIPELYKRSQRLFTFNHGDTRGQVTKLLAGAQITYPDQYEDLQTVTFETIHGKLPVGVEDYISWQAAEHFPDLQLLYNQPEMSEHRLRELIGI